MVRLVTGRVTSLNCFCNVLADRATPGAVGVLPGEPVLLAWRADDLLRVLIDLVPFSFLEGILVLSFHVSVTDCDCAKFVFADAPFEDLLLAGSNVEAPFPGGSHDWYRKRPVLGPYRQDRATGMSLFGSDSFLLASHCGKSCR